LIRARAALADDEADAIDAEVEQVISEALAFAQQSPVTGPDALAIDHYTES
jgi:TPP-dependent pyruvate/acetoin dehydrogenase alpha subunit